MNYINSNSRKAIDFPFEGLLSEDDPRRNRFSDIYTELIDHFIKSMTLKLNEREYRILYARFGIEENSKTLEEIGREENKPVSRERVRQIINKAINRMRRPRMTSAELIDLEYTKTQLVSEIDKLSAGGFITFLLLEGANVWFVKSICKVYFGSDVCFDDFKRSFKNALEEQCHQQRTLAKSHSFNDKIFQLITFPQKRAFSDDEFAMLKTERTVNREDEELKAYVVADKTYQCESFLEKQILDKFLQNNTFKEIKTQSLKIPHKDRDYHPDFQCLTHDNLLVLVEVKPLLDMGYHKNIEKFHSLKMYCQEHGCGYLIIDGRWNSFEAIDEENESFNELILSEIDSHGYVSLDKYKEIRAKTKASNKHMLTLIKKQNLLFYYGPFRIKKSDTK